MPTECLILRRVSPVPVTFADLRRAHDDSIHKCPFREPIRARAAAPVGLATWWHAAIKEATGALDEVYAVIDGHEVRIAIVHNQHSIRMEGLTSAMCDAVWDLSDKADKAGYWQRPHEVRHVIEETMMSTRTRDRIALNSFAVAVATEWTDALIVAAGDDQ